MREWGTDLNNLLILNKLPVKYLLNLALDNQFLYLKRLSKQKCFCKK
jgi:hypothetical protein